MRSRESLKNAICVQAGLYDDLETSLDKVMQKKVTEELNASNCRALEGGYMSTQGLTYVRNSSFYLTDAIAVDSFINEYVSIITYIWQAHMPKTIISAFKMMQQKQVLCHISMNTTNH